MRIAGRQVDTIAPARIFRRTRARTSFARRHTRTHCRLVRGAIAVVILAVAHFGGAAINGAIAIVTIIAATNDRRLPICVLVQARKRTYRHGQIAMNVGLARVPSQLFQADRIVGTNHKLHAALREVANLPRRTTRLPAIRSNHMLTRAPAARVNGTGKTIAAIGGRRTAPRAPRAPHTAARRVVPARGD